VFGFLRGECEKDFENHCFRVINKLFNKTMQKLSVKLSKGGPHGISERGGPRRPPRSPPLLPSLDYMYRMFSVQEVNILLNLSYAIKRRFSIECFYIRLL